MITAELGLQIAAVAQTWVKSRVKYLHRGTTRIGCDCTGLLIGVMQELGYLKSYHLRKYPLDWNLHSGAQEHVCDALANLGILLPKLEVRPGDVVVFSFGRCVSHAGIVIDSKMFAHALLDSGKCTLGMLRGSPWTPRWAKSYRWDLDKIRS